MTHFEAQIGLHPFFGQHSLYTRRYIYAKFMPNERSIRFDNSFVFPLLINELRLNWFHMMFSYPATDDDDDETRFCL